MNEETKLTKISSCGGWGAKVGEGTLDEILFSLKKFNNENLLIGFNKNDDASVYKISDDIAIIESLDFFPPIVDDPYAFGQIVAANSLSDIYSMGGTPTTALNILCIKKDMDISIVKEILKGGYDKAYEAGCAVSGGHTINGEELLYGMSVSGIIHPNKILSNSNAKIGDYLILTKKVGIGIIATALKANIVSSDIKWNMHSNDHTKQICFFNS